jgi:multidrug efflux system outer membrane protein
MSRTQVKRWQMLWILGLSALLEAGCVVGPKYHAPNVTVPDGWTLLPTAGQASASVATPGNTAVAQWWTTFKDSKLDALVNQAMQSNLSLQQARARILQARAARTGAGASLWPSVNASVTNTTSSAQSGSFANPAATSGTARRNLFQAGIDAAWELDLFGGTRRSIEAADADLRAAIEDSRDVMVTLTAEVALNYITLRGVQQQIVIAQQNLEAQRKTADITRRRLSVGFVSALDVANAEAQVATTGSQIPVLEAAGQQTIYALSVLLGREPSALVAELSPIGTIPATPPAVPVGLPSELLVRRPDIRRAEAQLHSATAQIGVATADLFPKFSLTGPAGGQRLTQGSLLRVAGGFWSVIPAVTQPIFTAGKVRANIRVQTAIRQQALLTYQQTVLTALQDVESALIAYAKDQERRAALASAVASNRIAVDLSTRLYTAGELDFLNLLTAQRNLYTSEDALVQTDRTIALDLIGLYKGLGGGWQLDTQPGNLPKTGERRP